MVSVSYKPSGEDSSRMLHRDFLGQVSHFSEELLCAVHATAHSYRLKWLNFLYSSWVCPQGARVVAAAMFWRWRNMPPVLSLLMPRHASLHQGEEVPHQLVGGWSSLDQDRGFLDVESGISWRGDEEPEIKRL